MVFERAGFTVNTYPYYDDATGGLKFDAMVDAIGKLPKQSIVLLHACCHNPTGVDLNQDQWRQLIGVLKAKELLPFVDMAYQASARAWTKTRSRSANWNARACRAWWPTRSRRTSRCTASAAAA